MRDLETLEAPGRQSWKQTNGGAAQGFRFSMKTKSAEAADDIRIERLSGVTICFTLNLLVRGSYGKRWVTCQLTPGRLYRGV